ncbi:putative DNA binding domain-containing protein [Bacillus cereus]|uniref:ATP-binding protein n=1 Tax=Bacillus cereus TaxID=1396 RepID=UPI0018F5E4E7|nr:MULTISPECIES: ATP-binding protein [Bacillus]MBJ8061893.1 putative DNA binding domain-containing protein [Bacillus cereus]MCU5108025.1 putative DNA binding domain-containing protein [Bacillus cereus]
MYSVEELLTMPEGQYFDRKSARIPLTKLSEAIVGFANADGGTIAIGIDNRKIEGIDAQGNQKINDFIQCAFDKCIPSIKIQHQFLNVVKENGNEDRLLIIEIESSVNQLHTTTSDTAYLRVGDETIKLNHEQRTNLEYDKGTRLYEDSIIEDCTFDDLDIDLINEYKSVVNFNGEDLNRLLFARGFAKRTPEGFKYTVAGVLMFCKYPTAFIPGAKVRFIRYEGKSAETGTRMNIIKQETFDDPIPTLIEKVKLIVQSQLREFTALDRPTGKFHSVPEYPIFAWQEGIVNAVTHRAYNIHGDDIKIIMYDDRLEIISPGKLPNIVSVKNIKEVRYSRNPKIARALTEIGWVRELGEGVKRIFEEMNMFFLEDPLFIETQQSVKLVLKNNIVMRRIRRHERIDSNISGKWDELGHAEKTALEIIYNKGKVKTMELAESLNITRQPAKKVLDSLVDKGFLRRVSTSVNDPNQYYEMLSDD